MIHIIYRHTSNASGIGKNRPYWFSYEKSLNNILSTIDGLDFVRFGTRSWQRVRFLAFCVHVGDRNGRI